MSNRIFLTLTPIAFLACSNGGAPPPPIASAPPSSNVAAALDPFAAHGLEGCFALFDMKADRRVETVRPDLCATRRSPCSTFKVFNAMAGLEAGVVADENTVFKWDGEVHDRPALNHDHTLASAMKDSVVWYFQHIAKGVGMERMQRYVDAANYGNRDLSGGITTFWLESSLQISADENLAFVTRLYRDDPTLPFSARSRAIDRKILVLANEDGEEFSGKTGTSGEVEGKSLGWFVGHVKTSEGEWSFALNAIGPKVTGPSVVRPIAIEALLARGILKHAPKL